MEVENSILNSEQMSMSAPFCRYCQAVSDVLIQYILPFGLLVLFTGMFWIGDRSDYHKLFYVFTAAPVVIVLFCNPEKIVKGGRNVTFISFLLFSFYMLTTLLWSGTDNATFSLVKRPLYIALLFYAVYLVDKESAVSIEKILILSLLVSIASALLTFSYWFLKTHGAGRFPGYGALYNPLLTAHIYGAYAALALALWFRTIKLQWLWFVSFVILFMLLLMTGSRTPLFGLFAVLLWLLVTCLCRRALLLFISCIAALCAIYFFNPVIITSRGFSYRPEIWQEVWFQIAERPWFGYGYDHPMLIKLSGVKTIFCDPHNLELAVFFAGGVVALLLWLTLYGVAIISSLQERNDSFVAAISSMLVFGFAAGLTEGKGFLSRPDEHWFLVWIPMALISAASSRKIRADSVLKEQ